MVAAPLRCHASLARVLVPLHSFSATHQLKFQASLIPSLATMTSLVPRQGLADTQVRTHAHTHIHLQASQPPKSWEAWGRGYAYRIRSCTQVRTHPSAVDIMTPWGSPQLMYVCALADMKTTDLTNIFMYSLYLRDSYVVLI